MNVDYKVRKIIKWLEDSGGVYPKKSENSEIHYFISYIRNRSKNGLLKDVHLQMLKSIKFQFSMHDQQWYSKFDKVKNFMVLNNGQLPRMGNRRKIKEFDCDSGQWLDETRKKEYLLGKWVQLQRELMKNGKIKHYRKQLLDSIDMGIDGYKRKWDETFYELYNYAVTENSIPRPNENNHLYNWFQRNLVLYDNHELKPRDQGLFSALITLLKSDFRPRVVKVWNERYNELKDFVKNNNRLPDKRKNRSDAEISLIEWIGNQKHYWKNNTLSKEKVMKLEMLGVEFKKIDFERDWLEKFAGYCDFKNQYNREPKITVKSGKERELALWAIYNRSLYKGNYEGRELPDNRYLILRGIDFQF